MQTQKETKGIMIPITITTPTGLVVIWGSEYVSTKMLGILKTMLSHDAFESIYHGIKSVIFRVDGYPKINGKNICASFSPDVSGISINLEKTLERAIDRSMDHPETSLLASWWLEMLLNFGHEIHHGATWDIERNRLHDNEKALAEEEDAAEKYSDALIVDLAQEYDLEMSCIEEEVWFNSQIIELLGGKDESDKWAKAQKEMITEKIVWRHEPKDNEAIVLHTFKDFMCLVSEGDAEAEEWNKNTIEIKPNSPTLDKQLNGKKITINADGEQGEVTAPAATPGIYEDYSGIYEEGEGEYGYDDEEAEITPLPVQPTATVSQPATNVNQQPQAGVNAESQDITTVNRVAQGVYMKMYNFIFQNCGPLRDSDVGFNNPEAVLNNTIPLTPEEASIFVSMNHLDINGRWCPNVSTKNGLLGKVMKNTKLPAYEITLNVNGIIHRRLFIPQNPAKRINGTLTQRAVEARAGNAIAYIIVQDDDTNGKWGPYIINGEYKLPQAR